MSRRKKEYIEIEVESVLNYLDVEELEMLEKDAALKNYMIGQRGDGRYTYSAIIDGKLKFIKTSINKHIVIEAAIEYNRKQSA